MKSINRHLKIVAFLLSALISFQGFSQNYFDLLNFTFTNTPPNDFEISNSQTTVEELALEIDFPIIINERTIFFTGLFANKTKVDLEGNRLSSNLNVLGLNFGVNKSFNDKWSATFMTFPKIASDKIKLSNENFQLAFLSLFTYKKRDNLKYRYGLYANTEKYGVIFNYKIRNKLWLGMKFDGLGTTYNLSDQHYSVNGAYVSKTSNELVSYLRFQLNKSIFIDTKVGYAISRNYKVYDANDKISLALGSIYFGDHRTQLNERFEDGAIFRIKLLYRLHFD
jgi:hypothetical protein